MVFGRLGADHGILELGAGALQIPRQKSSDRHLHPQGGRQEGLAIAALLEGRRGDFEGGFGVPLQAQQDGSEKGFVGEKRVASIAGGPLARQASRAVQVRFAFLFAAHVEQRPGQKQREERPVVGQRRRQVAHMALHREELGIPEQVLQGALGHALEQIGVPRLQGVAHGGFGLPVHQIPAGGPPVQGPVPLRVPRPQERGQTRTHQRMQVPISVLAAFQQREPVGQVGQMGIRVGPFQHGFAERRRRAPQNRQVQERPSRPRGKPLQDFLVQVFVQLEVVAERRRGPIGFGAGAHMQRAKQDPRDPSSRGGVDGFGGAGGQCRQARRGDQAQGFRAIHDQVGRADLQEASGQLQLGEREPRAGAGHQEKAESGRRVGREIRRKPALPSIGFQIRTIQDKQSFTWRGAPLFDKFRQVVA